MKLEIGPEDYLGRDRELRDWLREHDLDVNSIERVSVVSTWHDFGTIEAVVYARDTRGRKILHPVIPDTLAKHIVKRRVRRPLQLRVDAPGDRLSAVGLG